MRVGVVGVGQRAALAQLVRPPARVVACADPSASGRTHAHELFGPDVATYAEVAGLLGHGLDAVFVTSPDDAHAAPVLAALEAGVATFVEKPLAVDLDDCDRILEAARRTGTRLYVGHNLRHAPVLRRMRELVESGAIGTVRAVWCRHFVGHGGDYYFKDWHAERRRTTGLLLQKGAHDLDVIHWLAGGTTRQVVAMGGLQVYGDPTRRRAAPEPPGARMGDWFDPDGWPPTELRDLNPVVDVEDLSMLVGRLSTGALVSYQQCHFTPDYWRSYTVIGDAGRLENFGDGLDGQPATIKVWNQRRSAYREDADQVVVVDPSGSSRHGGADEALVAEFLRFAAEGGETDTSPVAAREAVAAGICATTSLREGARPVDVPPLDADLVAYFEAGQVTRSRG